MVSGGRSDETFHQVTLIGINSMNPSVKGLLKSRVTQYNNTSKYPHGFKYSMVIIEVDSATYVANHY